ncbi:MAG: hypothetical protein AB1384_11455 [Actinomycetota bacterium]
MSRKRGGYAARLRVIIALVALACPTFLHAETAAAFGWTRTAVGGFGGAANTAAGAMAEYEGRIYAGTYNARGCQVWSTSGISWTQEVGGGGAGTPTGPGFGNAGNVNVSSLAVYGSRLYAGVRNPGQGCQVWSYDGEGWTQEVGGGGAGTPTGPGFGDSGNNDVTSMAVMEGLLYAGTYNAGGCQVWSYDGTAWKRVAEGGFGDADNLGATSMAVYFQDLYVGTLNNDYSSGCQVWSYDGEDWTQQVGQGGAGTPIGPGFGDSNNRRAASMAVYDYGLYVGTYDSSGGSGCQVWFFDGANWTRTGDGGFGDTSNLAAECLVAGGLDLYAGTYNEDTGCEVWRYDGAGWDREGQGGFGDAGNVAVLSMLLSGSDLLVGTQCEEGCQAWEAQVSSHLYFAEGYTGGGFQEYLCLGNPHPREARASITYLFTDATSLSRKVAIPAESRLTVFVNTDVSEDREVAVELESDLALAAERPMYFTYGGDWRGGHDAMGAPSPSTTWYFAEGYTGSGFHEWICVLNPSETRSELTFRFQTQESGEQVRTGFSVSPRSRASFLVNDILGTDLQNSLELEASAPVVAERPMYFDYRGTQDHHWQGGHCAMGATELSQLYFFAEGTTRSGFEEWLTLQNPNPVSIVVNASYQMGPGQGAAVNKSYTVPAGRRSTVYVPDEVGKERDVSVVLASTAYFLAERPMYFLYTGYGAEWPGGDCVIGAGRTAVEWFLAEGYTGGGYHTWLCLHNPGIDAAQVMVVYYTEEEGPLEPRLLDLPAGTRLTVFVNDHAGNGYQLSTRVISSRPIVVERPMYFDTGGGVQGGHVMVGRDER